MSSACVNTSIAELCESLKSNPKEKRQPAASLDYDRIPSSTAQVYSTYLGHSDPF